MPDALTDLDQPLLLSGLGDKSKRLFGIAEAELTRRWGSMLVICGPRDSRMNDDIAHLWCSTIEEVIALLDRFADGERFDGGITVIVEDVERVVDRQNADRFTKALSRVERLLDSDHPQVRFVVSQTAAPGQEPPRDGIAGLDELPWPLSLVAEHLPSYRTEFASRAEEPQNTYLHLDRAPTLRYLAPLCSACQEDVQPDGEGGMICPGCGTHWTTVADNASGVLYADWSGETPAGPRVPRDDAYQYAGLPSEQRLERLYEHRTRGAEQ